MAKIDPSKVADVYAQSLFDLARERGQIEAVREELDDLAAYLEKDEEFAAFLSHPGIDADRRRPVLDKLFRGKLSDLLLDTVQVLNRRERLGELSVVANRYRRLYQESQGEVDVLVTSATPLSGELREKLSASVRGFIGKTPHLIESTDPKLLGGLVIRIGDTKLDSSVVHRIGMLREALLQRASMELHSGRSYFEGVGV